MGDPLLTKTSKEVDEVVEESKATLETEEDPTDETSEDVVKDEETESEEPAGDESSEGDETDDWSEWSKQEGLPDTIDSPEKLAESYKSALTEMKRGQTAAQQLEQIDQYLKSHGVYGGIQGLIQGAVIPKQEPVAPVYEKPQDGKSYFDAEPVTKTFEQWKKSGRIPEDLDVGFRTISTLMDESVAPQFRLAEQVMTTAMKQVVALRDKVRSLEWKSLEPKFKSYMNRAEADGLIDRGLVTDYEEAAGYLAFKNGNVLRDVATKAEQRGQEKARKKFRRGKSIRAERSPLGTKWNYKQYQNDDGSWNQGKLFRLGKDANRMLDDWLKENKT